jgi:predicted nucleic acid binding AN1-type Zn finger protein
MAVSAEADLMGLGEHCSVAHCQQLDFLPFKCDGCKQTFCLDHRTYAAHKCPNAGKGDVEVIVCPVCASGIHLRGGEDPNAAFERHTRSGCDPSNYARVHKKPRCPAQGCREKLTSINTYACKACNQRVCLKHRFPEDHKCPGKAGRACAARRQQLHNPFVTQAEGPYLQQKGFSKDLF